MNDDGPAGPLQHLRVLDLTGGIGRYGAKLLAENGADVLRLQPGERGPDLSGPQDPGLLDWWHDAGCRLTGLELADAANVARFRSLVAACDVLIDGRPAPAMAQAGLSPDDLAAINPALVHVSITPQGFDGPRSGWRSSDLVAQALGGYLSVTGDPDHPVALWGRQAQTVGGFYAAVSALAGVHRARRTGRGSWVDLSLHQALVSCSEHLLMYWWFPEVLAPLGAPVAGRQRSLHWIRAFEVVPCKRGDCMVSPAAGGLLGLIAWLKERGHAQSVPDEPDDGELLGLVPKLMEALHAVARQTDATELFEAGQSLHVPFGEAYTIDQVAQCVQHLDRGFFRAPADWDRSRADIRLPGPLARFGDTPCPPPSTPSPVEPDAAVSRWSAPATVGGHGGATDEAELPLAGIRVLDFTHVLAGPFATRVLADLGADVIRVQTDERSGGASSNDYPYNILWARSKRSIQLQMKHPDAATVLADLVARADVVIDNFSHGVMEAWGAGPEQLAVWNPAVISMSMSGCGSDGPWRSYVTYAPTVHALCGLTALTGPAGETDCGPGIAFNDHVSGLAGATSLLSALASRSITGRGQHIEMSQYEVGTYLVGPAIIDHLASGRVASSAGNTDPFAPLLVNDVFRAADDQWLAVTIVDDRDLERTTGLGLSGSDPHRAVAAWVAGRTAAEAQDELQQAGVAAGVVQTAAHFADHDPQLAHRDWQVSMDSAMIGNQHTERHPARWFSGGRELEFQYRPSPYLGEHNFEVYEELLGWDAERVAMAIGDELIL